MLDLLESQSRVEDFDRSMGVIHLLVSQSKGCQKRLVYSYKWLTLDDLSNTYLIHCANHTPLVLDPQPSYVSDDGRIIRVGNRRCWSGISCVFISWSLPVSMQAYLGMYNMWIDGGTPKKSQTILLIS